MALKTKNATQETGEVYAMHFVYSGNFKVQVQADQFDQVRMVMGIHPTDFAWRLESKEEFQAPEVVMVYSDKGLGQMTRTVHDFYRKHLIRSEYKNKKRPILINNWEATYFDFNTENPLIPLQNTHNSRDHRHCTPFRSRPAASPDCRRQPAWSRQCCCRGCSPQKSSGNP